MLKSKSHIIILILGILSLVSGACAESPAQTMTATPLEVPKEGILGEYITVRIQLSSDQPCKLILSSVAKTEVDNYLAPYTTSTLTYPDNNKIVVWHERIPGDTVPGRYILRVFQMAHDGDKEGKEIFSQDFIVR
jgi:hypothetical protein